MQARVEKERVIGSGELLGELRAKTVTTTVKEFTAFGIRQEVNWRGEFAGGKYNAGVYGTRDAFLKANGTFDWASRFVQTTKEGDIICAESRGTGRTSGPIMFNAEGEVIFITESPKFSWLNMKKARLESKGDSSTGEFETKYYML